MIYSLKNKDIIVFGLQPWDIEIGSNCKNIALELSKNNRVLYVNRALDRLSIIRNKHDPKIQSRLKALNDNKIDIEEVETNLFVFNPSTVLESIAKIPFNYVFNKLNYLNNKRISKEILKAANSLGFSTPVLFIDNEFFRAYYLKELIPNQLFIYYIRDYLVEQDYFKTHGKRLESDLIRKADLVVTNSIHLADYASDYNRNSFFIGQGCDLSLFDPEKETDQPADMINIKKPIIGYVGALVTSRLDLELLEYLALNKTDWSFVLVGPEDMAFRESTLHSLENVHFPGPQPKNELAKYIKEFDVCINPQIRNSQTEGNYPLKIDEYLAMGKPVVATYTRAMEMFEDYVYLARNKFEYLDNLKKALSDIDERLSSEGIRLAKSHTWKNCIENLEKAISKAQNE